MSIENILCEMEERVRVLRDEPSESIDIFPTVRILREQARLIAALRKAIEQRDERIDCNYESVHKAAADHYNTELASILRGDSHGGEG